VGAKLPALGLFERNQAFFGFFLELLLDRRFFERMAHSDLRIPGSFAGTFSKKIKNRRSGRSRRGSLFGSGYKRQGGAVARA
jgi:hypothetical protein